MKKLLKLLFVLSGTTTLPLTVIACGQESLDSTLNIIYINGDTKYNIKDFFPDKDISKPIKTISLTLDETNQIAKKIVETILKNSNPEISIPWHDEVKENNQKSYHFNVTNGKSDETGNNLIWEVNQVTQRFSIKINYLVGSTISEDKFVAKQKIDKTFTIKCGTSESDNQLTDWIKEFNNQNWDISNPLTIDLSQIKVELPKKNTSWSDLNKEIIKKTNEVLYNKINEFNSKNVSWIIKSTNTTITEDMKLELQISANLNDASQTTETFYVLFKK